MGVVGLDFAGLEEEMAVGEEVCGNAVLQDTRVDRTAVFAVGGVEGAVGPDGGGEVMVAVEACEYAAEDV